MVGCGSFVSLSGCFVEPSGDHKPPRVGSLDEAVSNFNFVLRSGFSSFRMHFGAVGMGIVLDVLSVWGRPSLQYLIDVSVFVAFFVGLGSLIITRDMLPRPSYALSDRCCCGFGMCRISVCGVAFAFRCIFGTS